MHRFRALWGLRQACARADASGDRLGTVSQLLLLKLASERSVVLRGKSGEACEWSVLAAAAALDPSGSDALLESFLRQRAVLAELDLARGLGLADETDVPCGLLLAGLVRAIDAERWWPVGTPGTPDLSRTGPDAVGGDRG